MSERNEGAYKGVGYVVMVEGYQRYFRYCIESDAIKECMAKCNEYRYSNDVDYDEVVESMMKDALNKYDSLAKWIGVKNVVTDIRSSMRIVRDAVHQNGDIMIDLPDDMSYPPDGVEGDGAFVRFVWSCSRRK